jgi:CHAD domain-containing protein
MKIQRLFRRWQRHYRKLFERQQTLLRGCLKTGGQEEVHDLRVTLRRLRLMLRIVGPFLDSDCAEEYGRWSHQVLNATGRLRDCDAVLEWLVRRSDTVPLRERLCRYRQKLWREARAGITPLPHRLRHGFSAISLSPQEKARLEDRFHDHFTRLEEAIRVHLPEFLDLNAEEQHTFRRKLRRLRYLREIALPRRRQREDSWLAVIVQLQTAMGECQNLTIAERLLTRTGKALLSSTLLAAMSRERAVWEKEIRRCSRKLRRISRR